MDVYEHRHRCADCGDEFECRCTDANTELSVLCPKCGEKQKAKHREARGERARRYRRKR